MLLAIQLYTVRDLLSKDLKGTLRALRSMGFDSIEGASGYDLKPQEWKDLMGELGFTVVGGHVGLERLATNPKAVAEEAKLLGYSCAIVPWASGKNYPGGWHGFARVLQFLGGELTVQGLTVGYHNHSHEMENVDGKTAYEVILDSTDPATVKAQIDIGWVTVGGKDPATLIRKYGDRLDSVHLKDTQKAGEHIDVVAGTGAVDWDAAIEACMAVGCRAGAIEMDNPPGDALKSVEKSVEFYRSKGVGS